MCMYVCVCCVGEWRLVAVIPRLLHVPQSAVLAHGGSGVDGVQLDVLQGVSQCALSVRGR
jgi:hypothetical protein